MLHIADHSFTWLFPGGHETLAVSLHLVAFCFPTDIGLQALFFLAHIIFDAVQSPSFFSSAGL